jgi:ribosomal protein S13
MAKYELPFDSTHELFNQVIDKANLSNYMKIGIYTNNRAKVITDVKKSNDIYKYKTGEDIIIYVNEKIFEQLPEEQQLIVVEEAIAGIGFDTEHDKVIVSKSDFSAHSGILIKYTFETVNVVRESIKTLYQVEKQAEDERKANAEKATNKKF